MLQCRLGCFYGYSAEGARWGGGRRRGVAGWGNPLQRAVGMRQWGQDERGGVRDTPSVGMAGASRSQLATAPAHTTSYRQFSPAPLHLMSVPHGPHSPRYTCPAVSPLEVISPRPPPTPPHLPCVTVLDHISLHAAPRRLLSAQGRSLIEHLSVAMATHLKAPGLPSASTGCAAKGRYAA